MRSALLSLASLATLWLSVAAQSSVEAFIAKQAPISKAGVFANIGPSGSKSQGAKAGIIIASPSKVDPDYVYTWTRDAALVTKNIIDTFIHEQDPAYRTTIDNFVHSQKLLQQVSNPSGTVSTGGLGEPKFNIDMSPFTGGWGRPQRDGPALRATALITYANWLIENSNTTFVTNTLWPIIKLDLDYSEKYWNQTGFDLWEEVSSASFFTTAAQHRALREGAALATKIRQTASVAGYLTQATNSLCFLQSYWNPTGGYVISNTGGGRSGKDANSVLASMHNFDITAGCDAITFQPCSDKALSNLKVYVDAFRSIYKINSGYGSTAAVATGRYPEDVYYNGNPWYLTTTAVSEQLYYALTTWDHLGSLEITSISLAFFRQFSSTVAPGTYEKSTATYTTLTTAIKKWADDFLLVVAKWTPADGSLAEQYERNSGYPLSAKDLTWSYAASLSAFAARDGFVPASWGAKDVKPGNCGTNSGPSVQVTFNVVATAVYGENIYITGNLDALKSWSPENAILLSAANYPTWSVTLSLPASTNFEFKFIRKNGNSVTWEQDPNRQSTTPASGSYTVNQTWR